jgi:hypothetical protein
MICSRCPADVLPANLTTQADGARVCPCCLYAEAVAAAKKNGITL